MATSRPLPRPEDDPTLPSPPMTDVPVAASTPASNRPFVIAGRSVGSGGGDKTNLMLLIIATVVLVFIGFIVLISTKGSRKQQSAVDQTGKPSLGRVVAPPIPGHLVPQDTIAATGQGADAKSERWRRMTSRRHERSRRPEETRLRQPMERWPTAQWPPKARVLRQSP